MKSIIIFDPFIQEEAEHTLSVDKNGEIVAQSTKSNHFVKFPAGYTAEDINNHIAEYKLANEGQVSAAEANAQIEEQTKLINEIGFDSKNESEVAPELPEATAEEPTAEPTPEQ